MKLYIRNLRFGLVRRLALGLAILLIASAAFGQKISAISLFESDSIVHVRLITDMKLLVKKKDDEKYQPATIQIIKSRGDTTSYDIEIKSRGETRKKVCTLPPIKLKFPEEDYSYNKLKWVLTCSSNDAYDQILLKEYMAYQFYQILSDKGFRTELLQVEYIDTGREGKSFVRYAFVIENVHSVADRIGGRVYSPNAMNAKVIDEDQLALFNMFQYMIANTDWAIQNQHNLKTITDPSTNSVLIVPYDFDYAGFVDAHYAQVHESLPHDNVRERFNKGFCMSEETCAKYCRIFISKREEILQACRDFKYFDKNTRKDTENYLKDFFVTIENEKSANKIFCVNCKAID
jgi:hypothetical protein